MSFIKTVMLKKVYELGKTEVHALRGISIEINKGEYLSIMGPSGAGKSTFLNLVGLLDRPSDGEILFDGKAVQNLSQKEFSRFRRDKIAFIFQSFNLVPVLDAWENIEYPLIIQKVPKKERSHRIDAMTEAVGIRDFIRHRPDELSGGQRQRVAIARALVGKPELVIADEPTANLDSENADIIMDIIRRLNRDEETTFLIASHDPKLTREADRVIKIMDGMISNVYIKKQ